MTDSALVELLAARTNVTLRRTPGSPLRWLSLSARLLRSHPIVV